MTEISEPLFYTSCFDLPLYNFIKISLYGEPEKYNVSPENWETIVNEFSELSGDKNMSQVFIVTKEIAYLTNRLTIIQMIVDQLSKKRIPGFIDILQKDLSFNFKFDDLEGDLNRVVSLSKSDVVKLQLAKNKFENLQKKGGESSTETDWYDELASLGKFQGYAIRPKETAVSEYLAIKKAFKTHVDHLIKNNRR